jgi:hypothetical protein
MSWRRLEQKNYRLLGQTREESFVHTHGYLRGCVEPLDGLGVESARSRRQEVRLPVPGGDRFSCVWSLEP